MLKKKVGASTGDTFGEEQAPSFWQESIWHVYQTSIWGFQEKWQRGAASFCRLLAEACEAGLPDGQESRAPACLLLQSNAQAGWVSSLLQEGVRWAFHLRGSPFGAGCAGRHLRWGSREELSGSAEVINPAKEVDVGQKVWDLLGFLMTRKHCFIEIPVSWVEGLRQTVALSPLITGLWWRP